MKKITSLLTLFLLFVGVGHAQFFTLSSTKYDISKLGVGQSATCAIKNVNDSPEKPVGYLKHIDNGVDVVAGDLSDSNPDFSKFVWTITNTAEGYTISQGDQYWPLPNTGNFTLAAAASAGKFVFESGNYSLGGQTSANAAKQAYVIHNKTSNTAIQGGFSCFHVNSGNHIGSWYDANPASLLYAQFYEVTVSTDAVRSSEITANGEFGKMYWYTMTLSDATNGGAVVFQPADNKSALKNKGEYDKKLCLEKLYAFVGNMTDGYEIYNCAAGPHKILWSESVFADDPSTPAKEDGQAILMTEKKPGMKNTRWILKKNGDGWSATKEGTEYACINSRDHFVGYWQDSRSPQDGNSKLKFASVDEASYLSEYVSHMNSVTGHVGGYAKSLEATSLAAAGLFERENTAIPFVQSGYYQIRAQREKIQNKGWGHYIFTDPTANAAGVIAGAEATVQTGAQAGDLNAIWKLDGDANFLLRNMNANLTLGSPQKSDASVLKCDGETSYSLVPSKEKKGIYSIKIGEGNDYFHEMNQNNKNIRSYTSNADQDFGSAFCLLPVNDIAVTVTDAKWATICLPMAVTVPAGVEAYYVSRIENSVIYVTKIADIIPANTPVLIFSNTPASYKFAISDEPGTALATGANKLFGSTVKRTVTAADYFGLIKNANSETVFAPYASDYIPANKVLLPKSAVPSQSQAVREFRIDFGEATGLENVEMDNSKSNVYYDLNGRRVLYPVHGIYVNGNGQKVFIK